MRSLSFRAVAALIVFAASLTGLAHAQSNWVNWVEETSTRLAGPPGTTTSDPQEKDIFAADFDRVGVDDVVIARKIPFSVPGGLPNVLLMNENGVLTDRTTQFIPSFATPDDARDILAFDANGDGWPDLVIATTFFEQPRLWINQGRDAAGNWIGFVEDTSWFSPPFSPGPKFCAVYDGDIDNDGDKDLFFSDYDSPLDDRLLINDGTGHFTDETDTRMSAAASSSVFGTGSFICDFTKDGWNDILKSSGAIEPLKLLVNDGTGHFNQVQVFNTSAAYMVRAADFNNDDRMDFYVVDDGQDYIYLNNSTNANGTIATTKIFVTGSTHTAGFGGNVHEADLNRDGYIDLGVADVDVDIPGCTRRFAALRNRLGVSGSNGFNDPNNPATLSWNSQGVHDFAWLDVDGDGFEDMIQGRCVGLRVWMMQPLSDVLGVSFCRAGVNSEGTQARIHGYGSTSIQDNDFRLVAEGAVGGQFGIFFYGAGQQPSQVLGDGFLCVTGSLFRLLPPVLVGGSKGLAPYDVDFNAWPAGSGPGEILAGSTWNFQFWYRDPLGQTATFNASDATAITFTP